MAQQFSRDQAGVILGEAVSEVFDTSGKDETIKPVYPKYLKKLDESHAKRISYQIGYFGEVPVKAEGAAIEYDDVKFGTKLTVDPDSFGLGVRFTSESLDDMALNPFGDFSSAKLVSAQRIGEAFRTACNQTQDVFAAQMILSMSSATATSRWQGAGWDAVALASTAHPILSSTSILGGVTYSNLGAAVTLSQGALQNMLTSLETIPTLEGLVRPLGKKYKLVVGPALRHIAFTIAKTTDGNKTTGTADHDVPGLSDFSIEVIVNPYLGASSTRYALIGPNFKGYSWMRKEPKVESEKDFETKGQRISVDYRFKILFEDAHDFIGSLGA